jgi:hypothetical protein
MKALAASALAFLIAGSFAVQAQSDLIIKQRAKNLQNTVNPPPGTAAPAAPAPPSASPPTPPPPPPVSTPVDAQLKENLGKLATDFAAIKSGAAVTDELRQTLEADFATLARGSVRPSQAVLTKLADDLCAALGSTNVPPREQGQLAQAVNVVVNSSLVTAAQAKNSVAAAQASLKSGGVADAAVQTVSADLNAILDEIQKKKPKLYQ